MPSISEYITLSDRGPSLDVGISRLQSQILTSKDCPRAEKIKKSYNGHNARPIT